MIVYLRRMTLNVLLIDLVRNRLLTGWTIKLKKNIVIYIFDSDLFLYTKNL